MKNSYRRKMENQLQQRNISGVRKSLKTISGQRTPDSQAAGDQTWVNDMNLFFNRFDQTPTPPPAQSYLLPPTTSSIPRLLPYSHLYLLLHGFHVTDPSPKRLQQLQTSCSHFTPDEDSGAAGPHPSPPSGGSFYGPTPFCLSTWHRSGRRHHLPPG